MLYVYIFKFIESSKSNKGFVLPVQGTINLKSHWIPHFSVSCQSRNLYFLWLVCYFTREPFPVHLRSLILLQNWNSCSICYLIEYAYIILSPKNMQWFQTLKFYSLRKSSLHWKKKSLFGNISYSKLLHNQLCSCTRTCV